MRILLTQNTTYAPAHGGAGKANRMLVEGLAERGHTCYVVTRAYMDQDPHAHTRFLAHLADNDIQVSDSSSRVVVFRHRSVEVHAVTSMLYLRKCLEKLAKKLELNRILVSSGGLSQILLKAVLQAGSAPVVYLARGTIELPFGPYSSLPSSADTELLRQSAGILTVSDFLSDYIREWVGVEARTMPISLFGPGPFPNFGRFDTGFVTMINPCANKGIAIFLELARRLPDVEFAAIPTWGTTSEDRLALDRLPNVHTLEPADDIDEIFAQTRILLMPSLWLEAGARSVVEAMLRGIPVLASDVGGIPEAKLGVDYLLPVRPIERYEERLNERQHPVPVVPEQDVGPWLEALQELLTDRTRYERLSQESREAALAFLERRGGVERIEEFLENLDPRPLGERGSLQLQPRGPASGLAEVMDRVEGLSPEKRALLLARLGKRDPEPG